MEAPEDDRPESLPEQLARLTGNFANFAYRTRAWWTPFAVGVAAPVLFNLLLLLLQAPFSPYTPNWAPHIATSLLGGAATTGLLFAGLGTALADRRVAVRWAAGFLAVAMLSALPALHSHREYSLSVVCSLLSGVVFLWSLWAAVGLVVRLVWPCVLSSDPQVKSKRGVRIADYLLLTAALAAAFALQKVLFDQADVEFAPIDGWTSAALSVGALLQPIVPLFPVLWGAAPSEAFNLRRLGVTAAVSLVLLSAAKLGLAYATYRALAINFPLDYAGDIASSLGAVLGVAGAGVALRWAGYRLRRPAPG